MWSALCIQNMTIQVCMDSIHPRHIEQENVPTTPHLTLVTGSAR
jgi:hypothetical protein